MRYIGILSELVIIGVLLIFAGCNKQDEEIESIEESTVAIEESTEFVESVEEFEENGEKFYREIMGSLEIIYPRFDKVIVSKEKIDEYYAPGLSEGGGGAYIDEPLCMYYVNLKNIYDDKKVSKVNITVYNGSAFLNRGYQHFQKESNMYELCDAYEADLSGDIMASLYVLFEMEEMKEVKEYAKMASIVDRLILQSDVTYMDGTTKTEYLSLGSNEGINCKYMTIYRLEVEK